MSGGRFEHALAAFLRQEFGASVAAIIGFVDILIEDARRPDLADCLADLQRMREGGVQLSALIEEAVASGAASDASLRTHLRHELRTPLNAIKGYGELLAEEARDRGWNISLADLEKVLGLADRLLGEIDRIVEVPATQPIDIVGNVLQSIRPLGEAGLADPAAVASRILVVDDNEANRDLLSRRLVREGYYVTTAENGAAALALTAAEDFDLVLLDLMMPGMSGFEVLRRLKADAGTRHVPVIMISALDELDSAVRCIEAGADDYLPKPFNPVLLRARIGASLEKKRLLDELRTEKERSEALVLNILPRTIVERIRRGETVIADHIAEATILFPTSSISPRSQPVAQPRRRWRCWETSSVGSTLSRPGTGLKKSRPPATATWWRAVFPSSDAITPPPLRRWRSRCSMPSRTPAGTSASGSNCALASTPAR